MRLRLIVIANEGMVSTSSWAKSLGKGPTGPSPKCSGAHSFMHLRRAGMARDPFAPPALPDALGGQPVHRSLRGQFDVSTPHAYRRS